MKKYFILQLKRLRRFFPFALCITLVIFIGLVGVMTGVVRYFNSNEENRTFYIGITGDTDNDLFKWGIAAFETVDDIKYSVDFIHLSEEEAQKSLSNGYLSAYVVFPENFIENALMGEIDPVTYVTSAGSSDIVTMFKNEVTQLVTDIIVYAQKGAYGTSYALKGNGYNSIAEYELNEIAIDYVDLILNRSQLINAQELGISNGLSLIQYFVCGLMVLMLMLIGLPFVAIYVKKDLSLDKLLLSRGHKNIHMLMCEYSAHLISMLALGAVIFAVLLPCTTLLPDTMSKMIDTDIIIKLMLCSIPVLILISALNTLVFELSDNIVSAVLIHFFSTLSLCYICGCLYPIYTFPVAIQKIAVFLPPSICRSLFASCFTNASVLFEFLGLVLYTTLFLALALFVRKYKTSGRRG